MMVAILITILETIPVKAEIKPMMILIKILLTWVGFNNLLLIDLNLDSSFMIGMKT
jgi:hypothetical protein